tara:strand:+ start:126 stop:497 length:372 start_codon:yes stop_codon:yes gene_type:complete
MGIVRRWWSGGFEKHEKGLIVYLDKSEDYNKIWFVYDESLDKEKCYISFDKKKNKKYTSKDIKDIKIVKKKENANIGDFIFGKSTLNYLEITFKKGTSRSYQLYEPDNDNKQIEKFLDEYVLK